MWAGVMALALEPARLATSTVLADVHYQDATAPITLGRTLLEQYRTDGASSRHIPIFLMVGATSSTGDALGPFVGWFLKRKHFPGAVLGDLEGPVHATNIEEKLVDIRRLGQQHGRIPYVIAVDAAVGRSGHITVNSGPLRPGAGMGKTLPEVGHVHIMGGTASFPFLIWFAGLDQTVAMAEVIADGIVSFYTRLGSP